MVRGDNMTNDKILAAVTSVNVAAKLAGVTPRTVRRWCETGKLACSKPGGVYIIVVSSIPMTEGAK